jgi:hypothetical protein
MDRKAGSSKRGVRLHKRKAGSSKRGMRLHKHEAGSSKRGMRLHKREAGSSKRGVRLHKHEAGSSKRGMRLHKREAGSSKRGVRLHKREAVGFAWVSNPRQTGKSKGSAPSGLPRAFGPRNDEDEDGLSYGPRNDEFEGERIGFTFTLCLTRFSLHFGLHPSRCMENIPQTGFAILGASRNGSCQWRFVLFGRRKVKHEHAWPDTKMTMYTKPTLWERDPSLNLTVQGENRPQNCRPQKRRPQDPC